MTLVYPQINFFPKAVTPWYQLGSIPEVGIVHFIRGTNSVPEVITLVHIWEHPRLG